MKISVITVTCNSLPALQKTVESVCHQDYPDLEYIIIDGASQDGTAAFLKENGDRVTAWVSEPDNGIYEAMNKGVRLATGDYCIFMNAGDLFVHHRVLSRVSRHLGKADFVLGNEIVLDEWDRIIGYYSSRNGYTLYNLLTSSTCHQASLIRRNVLIEHPYDEHLRLVSDWKFILERYLEGNFIFKEINLDVCFFRTGGATERYLETGTLERSSVLRQYPAYESIWSKPYSPTLATRVVNKVREIGAHLCYLK